MTRSTTRSKQQIISGALQPDEGHALHPRELAFWDLRISVGTRKRAYIELEVGLPLREYRQRGFVAPKNARLLREEPEKIEAHLTEAVSAVRILRAEQGRAAGDAGTAVGGLNMNALELWDLQSTIRTLPSDRWI